jgi:hypothetical protein
MSKTCQQLGCSNLALPGAKLCVVHLGVREMANGLRKQSKRLQKRGDGTYAAICEVAADMAESDQVRNVMSNLVKNGLERLFQKQPQTEQVSKQDQKINPFDVLGLNPQTATVSDVRRVKAQLAKIYHPDAASTPVMSGKMQQVNAAASAAIAYITKRDSNA